MAIEVVAFPKEQASDLISIVSETHDLAPYLNPVTNNVSVVRMMLGNHERADQALAVWNEHAAGRIASSQTLVEDAEPSLDARWEGPAYR